MPEPQKHYIQVAVSSRPVSYPGIVIRQDLVDFCQGLLPELKEKNYQLSESIDLMERSHGNNIHTIHAFYEGLAENIGFQKALRQVCEWARENIVEPVAIGEPSEDLEELRAKLKGIFNGGQV